MLDSRKWIFQTEFYFFFSGHTIKSSPIMEKTWTIAELDEWEAALLTEKEELLSLRQDEQLSLDRDFQSSETPEVQAHEAQLSLLESKHVGVTSSLRETLETTVTYDAYFGIDFISSIGHLSR